MLKKKIKQEVEGQQTLNSTKTLSKNKFHMEKNHTYTIFNYNNNNFLNLLKKKIKYFGGWGNGRNEHLTNYFI